MYEDFFDLKGRPFELSPDPSFLFSSEKTKEALASISHAVARRKGFVVLTGEVGTGKTLVLRCLFELWEREEIPFAYIIGPRLSTVDFLSYIAGELGINVSEPSKGNLLRALYGFLLDQFNKGLTTVLVIDEAHQIPRTVLEEIRMLANFETAQQKLIQVLLVGQPELDKKLDSYELRSLKQRIAARCQLQPLGEEEIGNYVERRLRLCGADAQATSIFPVQTITAIYRYSQGIPRLVNSVCDQALMVAYTRKVRVVPVEIINEVALNFRLSPGGAVKQMPKASPALDEIVDSHRGTSADSLPVVSLPSVEIRHTEPISNSPINPADAVSTPGEPRIARLPAEVADVAAVSDASPLLNSAPETRSQKSEPVSSFTVAPRFLASANTISKPGSDLAEESAVQRAIHSFKMALKSVRLSRSRRWLLSGAVAIVAVTFTSAVLMSNRHMEAVTSASQTLPAMQQPQPASSAAAAVAASLDSLAAPPQTAASPALEKSLQPTERGSTPVKPPSPAPALNAGQDDTKASARSLIALSKPSLPLTKRVVLTSNEAPSIQGDSNTSPLVNDLALLGGAAAQPPPIPSAQPAAVPTPRGGQLQDPHLISSIPPVYPTEARTHRVQGVVTLDALIDETGTVVSTKVLAGPIPLQAAAEAALKSWKYQAARLNGKPIEVHTKVSIRFNLN